MTMPGPAGLSLAMRRTFDASRERVYRAWTLPEKVTHWMAPGPLEVTLAEGDARLGGSYRIHMRAPDGTEYRLAGTYLEVAAPERLVYTWCWESDAQPVETLVTVNFVALNPGRTEVILRHEHFPSDAVCAQHEEGWTACLAKLPAIVG